MWREFALPYLRKRVNWNLFYVYFPSDGALEKEFRIYFAPTIASSLEIPFPCVE